MLIANIKARLLSYMLAFPEKEPKISQKPHSHNYMGQPNICSVIRSAPLQSDSQL